MCGRFSLASNESEILAEFGVVPDGYAPRYNIAPTQEVAVIANVRGEWRAGWLRWGLVPGRSNDASSAARMINARAESVHTRPSFRAAFRQRRCLILADGFYEWRKEPGGPKRPYHVRLDAGRPFAFAGIWDRWTPSGGGEPLRTCALLTTEAPAALRAIHTRVPVILPTRARDRWLDPAAELADLRAAIDAGPGARLHAYPVSTRVNHVANDDAACIAAVGPALIVDPSPPTTTSDTRG